MLRSIKDLRGYRVSARDGDIGKVSDFYFDDQVWVVRYLVADTQRWLPGRKVLIPRLVLGQPDWERHEFPVELTKEQIQHGPPIEEDEPVSRQHEVELHKYLRIDPYWARVPGGAFHVEQVAEPHKKNGGDPHLRSSHEVIGYHIQATDGDIGHAGDLIVDDEDWIIRYLVADTKNVLPGKNVLIPPGWIDRVSWGERKVAVGLTRAEVRDSPEYAPATPVNREYEERLYDYYGRPYYWR